MSLFKTAVISIFVIALLAVISSSATAHLAANYTENETTNNQEKGFFDEMKEMHEEMHGGNFEEFHEKMFGENWREKMKELHESMDSGDFDEMAEHCPMMKNYGSHNEMHEDVGGMHKGMEEMHKSMSGMMH